MLMLMLTNPETYNVGIEACISTSIILNSNRLSLSMDLLIRIVFFIIYFLSLFTTLLVDSDSDSDSTSLYSVI
jgi:hypothetical protein